MDISFVQMKPVPVKWRKTMTRTDSKGYQLHRGESQRKSDGRYCYSYTDRYGKRRYTYAKTLVKLREKEKEIRRDYEDGIDAEKAKTIEVNHMIERYLRNKPDLKETTKGTYRFLYLHHIHDSIGKRKISDVKYSDIKGFYYSLIIEKELSATTVDHINTLLHPAFQMAVRDELIRLNPTDGVMKEIKGSKYWVENKRKALTIDEQTRFMDFVRENREYTGWCPIITVLLGTGLRIGELLGLVWSDINFEERTLSVTRTMNDSPDGDGICKKRIQTPKTKASIRDIPMISEVNDAFLREYELQKCLGFCEEEIDGVSGFIFSNSAHMVYTDSAINRALHQIVDDYNEQETENAKKENRDPLFLPYFSCHILRHTFCSRLCESEPNPKIAQEIMGHSDIQTTLNIYAGIDKSVKKKSVFNLDGKIIF